MKKTDTQRQVNWRLGIIKHASDISHNVAKTCRHYGISRQTFYKWARRYQADGDVGLYDQPRTPKVSPKATSADVVRKILYLRENYHFGPARLRNYLQRYHNIQIAQSSVPPHSSTSWVKPIT